MNHHRIARWLLGALALFMAPTALQATFTPRAWFDDFPLGRGWISAGDQVYDEHLVRDVGVLFLSLIVVTLWSVVTGRGLVPVAIAWLVQGSLHLVYHVGHLDGLGGADKAALVASLVSVPVFAAAALFLARPSAAPTPGSSAASS